MSKSEEPKQNDDTLRKRVAIPAAATAAALSSLATGVPADAPQAEPPPLLPPVPIHGEVQPGANQDFPELRKALEKAYEAALEAGLEEIATAIAILIARLAKGDYKQRKSPLMGDDDETKGRPAT